MPEAVSPDLDDHICCRIWRTALGDRAGCGIGNAPSSRYFDRRRFGRQPGSYFVYHTGGLLVSRSASPLGAAAMASTVSRLIHKRLAKGRGMKRIAVSSAGLLTLLIACTVGPDYRRPSAPVPTAYKELAGWKPATPMDGIERGPWWS